MQIKKIKLNNIRSYEEQEIEFPEGSTLLSGDIGSGKTSVLLAIEFALFGLQPGQRGSSLLRNGKDTGKVVLEFEVDGENILIERTLKRGKSINQDYCSITIDGEKSEISVTELKNKILEILSYPLEFSKKQNILYKFTVYTPQEEMKQIILQDSETRINTLRHVFGIDRYKRIIENVSILSAKLREEKRMKEGMISNLEQDKLLLIEKEEELEHKKNDLVSVEKELFLKTEIRKKVQEEQEEIVGKIEDKKKLEQEIEKTKIIISSKSDAIFNNKKTISQLSEEIKSLEHLRVEDSLVPKLEGEVKIFKIQREEMREKNVQITSKISSLSLKNNENESLKGKLSKMELCPTCLQDVNAVHKSNVANQLDSNTSENVKKIESLTMEKRELSEKLNKIEFELSQKEKQIQELRILKVKFQNLQEKQNLILDIEKTNLSLEKDISILREHMELLKDSIFDLKKFENVFIEKQKEFANASKEERISEIKVAELKKEIGFFSNQIKELSEKILKIEQIKLQLNYISSLENWLTKNFISLITNIEKNVMIKLKSEFSKLFSEWFSMLVSDIFNIRLDDDFTPIIEQQDYEIDYAYLSGGERTAVALAYRLALNQVINSLMSKIKTRDLVILDEPTDGFSETQLDKMRDVLQQLNVKQLIIVSHEQKIEGFVENVIRFKKEGGVSQRE